ncbi:MAG: RecQ family ATP-dependent DNA helicase, partial [Anaerolineae bacterium]|nr:RecQ family ATP-dependent DNA helicase [Anaerolineae bacterium]
QRTTPPSEINLPAISQLRQETSLSTPRQLTRYLCGITSPVIIKNRLKQQAGFGSLAHIPFKVVLAAVERMV